VGVIGAGLAGTLLAWRIRQMHPPMQVELVVGAIAAGDATDASGGLVRGFEVDPVNRELATDSLAELYDGGPFAAWTDYQEIGSVYLCATGVVASLDAVLARLHQLLPGSVRTVSAAELEADQGWAGLPAASIAVLERRAGYVSPGRLRRGVLATLDGLGVRKLAGTVTEITQRRDGVRCSVAGVARHYDVAVVAAGRWTAGLLARSDLPAAGYRTKAIQYGIYRATGVPPGTFVDETTGLYGRPAPGGRVLLGLPSDRWDVDPDRPPLDNALQRQVGEVAAIRFPRLRLHALERVVAAADAYADPPRLQLRAVPDRSGWLYTFTGGSGGAVKTALAASRIAAEQLAEHLAAGPWSGDRAGTDRPIPRPPSSRRERLIL